MSVDTNPTQTDERMVFTDEEQTHIVQQFLDLWITPEIERRRAIGTWGESGVQAAQVFLPSPLDGGSPTVRLNQEVRAVAKVKFHEGLDLKVGDKVFERHIREVGVVSRLSEDDQNAGLITLLLIDGKWFVSFDVRTDIARAKSHVDLAVQFALSANDSYESKRQGPAYDNLFSAAELAARAHLLVCMQYPYDNPSNHGAIFSRYRQWASCGNMPRDHSDTLNVLRKTRPKARYLEGEEALPDFKTMFWQVASMIVSARIQAGRMQDEEGETQM